ncbi:MAG TPA: DUF6286 domain-containing protein, partial [Mycobacterium sp.]|nr:DUF6286 domain-containing protein [Mycobacterium sp.]
MTTVMTEPAHLPDIGDGPQTGSSASRQAPATVAAAAASRASVLLAVGVIALGAIGIRDALIAVEWIGGPQWLPPVIDAVDGLAPAAWMVAAGAVLGVLGVALMLIAVLPRRRTALPLTAQTAVYLRRADVAKAASAAAREVPGVLDARTTSSRRKAVVRCRVTGATQEIREAVVDAVTDELAILQTPP